MLEYFIAIRNILRPFGTFYGHFGILVYFFPVLVYRIKKNLATLSVTAFQQKQKPDKTETPSHFFWRENALQF
jgi:hypothetical protein